MSARAQNAAPHMPLVLVVDDEVGHSVEVATRLERDGYRAVCVLQPELLQQLTRAVERASPQGAGESDQQASNDAARESANDAVEAGAHEAADSGERASWTDVVQGLTDPTHSLASLKEARDAFERAYLLEVLRRADGNVSVAARAAGRNRTDFYTLLRRHGITRRSA